jgi:hypothetical protein
LTLSQSARGLKLEHRRKAHSPFAVMVGASSEPCSSLLSPTLRSLCSSPLPPLFYTLSSQNFLYFPLPLTHLPTCPLTDSVTQ